MKVYVDDIRNPENHLSTEQAEGIVWIKTWREARNFILQNSAEIEVIHLDNFLCSGIGFSANHTGANILGTVMYRIDKFTNLKQIYLHSSDTDVVDTLYNNHIERCTSAGVELIKNSRPNRT